MEKWTDHTTTDARPQFVGYEGLIARNNLGDGCFVATLRRGRAWGFRHSLATPGTRRLSHKVCGVAFDSMNAFVSPSLSFVTTSLTDLQLAIMRILWDRAEATVLEVQNGLRPERDLAQTTIATLLSRLEKRSVVEHRLDGRQFVYRPLITEQDVRRSMVSELTALLFDGSSAALMSHLLRSREMNPGDLDRVKRMIADAENGARRGAASAREPASNGGGPDAG